VKSLINHWSNVTLSQCAYVIMMVSSYSEYYSGCISNHMQTTLTTICAPIAPIYAYPWYWLVSNELYTNPVMMYEDKMVVVPEWRLRWELKIIKWWKLRSDKNYEDIGWRWWYFIYYFTLLWSCDVNLLLVTNVAVLRYRLVVFSQVCTTEEFYVYECQQHTLAAKCT